MHIKCLDVRFDMLPEHNNFTDFYKFGQVISYNIHEGTDLNDLGLDIDTSIIYDISFDQSSTCTGIFLRDLNNTAAYIIEVRRTKDMDADDYIFELEMFVNELTKNLTILHLIYEKPIKTEMFRSSQVAFQLEGSIRQWNRRYSQFKNCLLDNIEAVSWKSSIVNKEVWGSNYTSKEASKSSIIELFPWAGFYGSSLYKDNDGYEAVGIMFGWYFCSFDPLGRPYVRGDEYSGNVGCIVIADIDAEVLAESLNQSDVNAKWFVFNPKLSTFKNIMKGAEKYQISVIQIEDAYTVLCVCIEANVILPKSGKISLVVATPENMSASAKRIIGTDFHFYL